MNPADTIVAISSASGRAARTIVRMTGAQALDFAHATGARIDSPGSAQHRHIHFADLTVAAWIYVFHAPRSYTGDNLVEFHLPGNPLLARMLLNSFLSNGARLAEPGEFTARAYFNGRIDLTEAEGVAATISANNEQELQAARQLMAGELARRLHPVMDLLAETLALTEVGIDFVDEDVTILSAADTLNRMRQIETMLKQIVDDSARLERLSHEPQIVLVGRPNAGKSTLLNALAGHQRAVVSPVAGTTRDVLSAEIALPHGIIRLTDIAGLEEAPANDEISQQMRDRALRALEEADRVVLVWDRADDRPPLVVSRPADLVVQTKVDLYPRDTGVSPVPAAIGHGNARVTRLAVSAFTGEGLADLRQALDTLAFGSAAGGATLALNSRHLQSLSDAREAVQRAISSIDSGPELLAADLREALDPLGHIVGSVSPDELLGKIFARFCIGK